MRTAAASSQEEAARKRSIRAVIALQSGSSGSRQLRRWREQQERDRRWLERRSAAVLESAGLMAGQRGFRRIPIEFLAVLFDYCSVESCSVFYSLSIDQFSCPCVCVFAACFCLYGCCCMMKLWVLYVGEVFIG